MLKSLDDHTSLYAIHHWVRMEGQLYRCWADQSTVKPVFKGYCKEGTPCDKGTLSQNSALAFHFKEPGMDAPVKCSSWLYELFMNIDEHSWTFMNSSWKVHKILELLVHELKFMNSSPSQFMNCSRTYYEPKNSSWTVHKQFVES